jgi:hypothetical protein
MGMQVMFGNLVKENKEGGVSPPSPVFFIKNFLKKSLKDFVRLKNLLFVQTLLEN